MQIKTKMRAGLLVCAASLWGTWVPEGCAQAHYPARPIRLLIPFPAGGAADLIGRTIGEKLAAQLGQPVVMDNRPGAGGVVATDLLAKAEPDGHTVLVGMAGPIAISPALNTNLPYNVDRDLLPITRVSRNSWVPRRPAGERSSGTPTSRSNSPRSQLVAFSSSVFPEPRVVPSLLG